LKQNESDRVQLHHLTVFYQVLVNPANTIALSLVFGTEKDEVECYEENVSEGKVEGDSVAHF